MEFLTLRTSDGARCKICLQGAHVCSWQPAGKPEQLFLSNRSKFSAGEAIRGGIPIIFPQFAGRGPLPKHGFARTASWTLQHQGRTPAGAAQAVLRLTENIARLRIWPHVFTAELSVELAGDSLRLDFSVLNNGDTTFSFTAALHTYLAVADIGMVSVQGLQGARYRDSAGGNGVENASTLRISGEIDRIYEAVSWPLTVHQAQQTLALDSHGLPDAVIWNPGPDAAVILADMEAGGDTRMLCVEAGAVLQAIRLTPGQSWRGSQTLSVR